MTVTQHGPPGTQDGQDRRRIGVLGVPTSAGSHNAGQDKAPAAWRTAGLIDALNGETALQVRDFGDLSVQRHRPSPPVRGARDLDRVAGIVAQVADRVADIRAAGFAPLVLGGDCTITIGVVGGLARTEDVGLLYFDGDADLGLPGQDGVGVLDAMGITHLLGDGVPELARSGPRHPLVPPDRLELFGFDPAELTSAHWARLVGLGLPATPAPAVRTDPLGRAAQAVRRLAGGAESVLVHFDVDVLDTGAFPLANFPHFAGLSLDEAAACLRTFCAVDAFAGLVVTEVNPDHDPDGVLLPALRDVLVAALAGT